MNSETRSDATDDILEGPVYYIQIQPELEEKINRMAEQVERLTAALEREKRLKKWRGVQSEGLRRAGG